MSTHSLAVLSIAAALFAAASATAEPLRVDINAEGRADMRTIGWENWRPAGDDLTRSFGGVTVTLRAGNEGGAIGLRGAKALVVHGVTLGADGAVATTAGSNGGGPAVLEVRLDGLAPGRHTLVGYHHALGGGAASYTVSAGDRAVEGVEPSTAPRHNDEVGISFIELEAEEGEPVVLRIAATRGDRVFLNAFAIDVSDPRKKALKPAPAHLDRHVDGDDGTVTLTWAPSGSAVSHHVYLVSDRDPATARRELAAATKDSAGFLATVAGGTCSAPIVANGSLLHYAWRVDSVDSGGKVTPGDVWLFRVRHLAFPGAEGYGRFALGGRGGRVIHVTTSRRTRRRRRSRACWRTSAATSPGSTSMTGA